MALLSHKPKRVVLSQPGKPLLGIRLKGEHAVLGTDHHIAPILSILDTWNDRNRLGRRLRFGGSRGTRASGLGFLLGRVVEGPRRKFLDGFRLGLGEQTGEICYLLV